MLKSIEIYIYISDNDNFLINNNFFKYGTMNELKFDSKLSSIYILLSSFSFEVFFLYISRQISHLTYHESKFFYLEITLLLHISKKNITYVILYTIYTHITRNYITFLSINRTFDM